MRAVVTGGAGFLGSHLVDRLVTGGHAVEVIDDLSTGTLANLASARAEATRSGVDCRVHTLDVRARELAALLARRPVDLVYHLAARPAGPLATEVTVDGTLNVLEAARAGGVRKVVTVCDADALYGEPREIPVKEGPLESPTTVAGAAAQAVVALLNGYRAEHALEFTVLALTHVYGPRRRDGVVAEFVRRTASDEVCTLFGDGRQALDFVYVDDAVDALVRAASRGGGLVVNVGSGVATPVRELHRLVAGDSGLPPLHAPARPTDRRRFAVSVVRARIHLAWAPWTSLADGVALTRAARG